MKLTDKKVQAALPGAKLTDDGDYGAGRLMLVVSPKGLKTWSVRSRADGKDQNKAIGRYPEMSLADAREAARIAHGKGLDKFGTLEQMLCAYRDSMKGRASYDDIRGTIETNRHDRLYKKEARSITPADVTDLLRVVVERGALVRANRWRSMLHVAFNYAAKSDHDPMKSAGSVRFGITSNPATITRKITEAEVPRERVLTDDELGRYLAGAKAMNSALGDLLLLQVYTGQRFIQLQNATLAGGVITVIDKKGRGNRVKVNKLPVLEGWKPVAERGMLAAALKIQTIRKASNALLPSDANALDLRRTIETRLQDMGVNREQRGYLLSHGSGGVQERHYEQAELLTMKKAILTRWFKAVEKIVVQNANLFYPSK